MPSPRERTHPPAPLSLLPGGDRSGALSSGSGGSFSAARRRFRPFLRLLPDSLFGRLFLIFTLSFLAFLIIGTVHASETRKYYILRGAMGDRAQRMAEASLLLDTAQEPERQRVMERLAFRGMRINLRENEPELEPTPPELADKADQLRNMLNLALEDIWAPDTAGEGGPDRDTPPGTQENGWKRVSRNQTARLEMYEVSVPSVMGSTWSSLCRFLGRQVPPETKMTLYRADAAVPLSDGTWVLFRDNAPPFPGLAGLPLKGILMVEVFFMLVSLVAFYLAVKPMRRLAQAAESLGRDLPGAPPLPETGPREVREGAQAFNRMQRRIREFVEERARTVAAVSHDLRTPLTRMRLRVEGLDTAARLPLQKDMDELQQLMDITIDLARSGSEDMARVDVASLLESLVEDRWEMGQNVVLEDEKSLEHIDPILARPLSVKRCLGNLIDNAVRYGKSRVTVGVQDDPDTLTVIIADRGPGIPEEKLGQVFEPFYRLEPSRNRSTGGSGLGLSIARSMARLHGGDIILTNRPGGGLEARVIFLRYKKNNY